MIYSLLLIIATIAFACLAWRNQKLAIFFILAALPSYLIRFQLGPIPITLLEVFVLIMIVRVFASEAKQPHERLLRHFIPRKDNLNAPIFLFLLAAIVGTIISPDKLAALGILKAYFIEPILFYFAAKSILTKDDLEPALKALGVGAIMVSLFGIIQYITRLGIPAPWDIERRVTSIFDFPNAVGLYLGPIVTMAIVNVFTTTTLPLLGRRGENNTSKWTRIFWIAVIILGAIAIALAQTEGAYVAIPASLLLVSFLSPRLRRWTISLTIIGLVAAMLIAPVRQKLTLHDYSGEVRRTQWNETVTMLKDHAIFGAGLAGYETNFAPYHQAKWVEIFQYPHNIILNIWSELGLLGLIAFVVLAIQVLRSSPLLSKEGQGVVELALLAALIEMTIHGLVDVPYFKNDLSLMTWALLALLVVSTHKVSRN